MRGTETKLLDQHVAQGTTGGRSKAQRFQSHWGSDFTEEQIVSDVATLNWTSTRKFNSSNNILIYLGNLVDGLVVTVLFYRGFIK